MCFRKSDLKKYNLSLPNFSAGRIDVPKDFELTAEEERVKLTSEIEKLRKKQSSPLRSRQRLMKVLTWHVTTGITGTYSVDRIGSMISGVPTDDVFIWSFWMPRDCRKHGREYRRPYESLSEFSLIEPDQGELPLDALLKNPGWSSSLWNRSPLCTEHPPMGELIRHLDGPFSSFWDVFWGCWIWSGIKRCIRVLYSKTPALAYAA